MQGSNAAGTSSVLDVYKGTTHVKSVPAGRSSGAGWGAPALRAGRSWV